MFTKAWMYNVLVMMQICTELCQVNIISTSNESGALAFYLKSDRELPKDTKYKKNKNQDTPSYNFLRTIIIAGNSIKCPFEQENLPVPPTSSTPNQISNDEHS